MLLAGTSSGLYAFMPGGDGDWQHSILAFAGANVEGVLARDDADLLAAVGGQGLFESVDGGQSWVARLEGVNPECLGSTADGTVFVGADPAAIHRRLAGAPAFETLESIRQLPSYPTWNFPNPPHLGNIHDLAFSALNPATVYAAVEVGGVIVSEDSGMTWRESREGLHLDVHGLTCATEQDRDVLYAATGQGFFRSEDRGESWISACDGLGSLYLVPVAVHAERPQVVFTAATRGRPRYWRGRAGGACATIYRSENGGDAWQPIMRGLPDTLPGQVEVLATDPRDTDTLYAGTMDGTVLIGRSRGESWSIVAQDLPPVHSFAFAS